MQSLVREGVEVVFGIPGIHMSGIIVALRDEPSIRMITTRHEAGATHMADGYSRASGKPGVALVVPGAGVYNAASGVATAYARSSPMLLIAGQIPRGAIGKNLGAIHEVFDQAGVMSPVTKWRRQVLRPREIPSAVNEAFRQMRTGRPCPVLLDIPPETPVEREEVQLRDPAPLSRIVPSSEDLREAARIIAQASLPLIFAGGGVAQSGAEQALVKLAETTNIPVVTSGGGKGAIPDSHPLCYGSCLSPAGEMHEMNQLYEVMQGADVVIGIGTRFSLGNPAGESCPLININIDDTELTRVQSNTIPLHGDANATIEALLPFLVEAAAGDRPSPDLILRHQAAGAPLPYPGDNHCLGRHAVRLLLPHPLPGEPPEDVPGLRLLLQPRFLLPDGAGREGGATRPPCRVRHRRRRIHVQRY